MSLGPDLPPDRDDEQFDDDEGFDGEGFYDDENGC